MEQKALITVVVFAIIVTVIMSAVQPEGSGAAVPSSHEGEASSEGRVDGSRDPRPSFTGSPAASTGMVDLPVVTEAGSTKGVTPSSTIFLLTLVVIAMAATTDVLRGELERRRISRLSAMA